MIHLRNYKEGFIALFAYLRPVLMVLAVILCFALFFAGVAKNNAIERDRFFFLAGVKAGVDYTEVIFSPQLMDLPKTEQMKFIDKFMNDRYNQARNERGDK